jgi:hypothetical protein
MHRIYVVLLCAACSQSATSNGNPDLGGAAAVTKLEVSPATASVALMSGTATSSFTAKATFADGSSADVSMKAAWQASPIGVMVQNGAVTATAAGRYTIVAVYGMQTASAQLDVSLTGSSDNTGFAAGDHAKLDAAPQAGTPTIAYPLDGALFPSNLAPIEVHVKKSDPAQTLARIRLSSGALLTYDFYAVCQASPNPGQFSDACIVPITGSFAGNLVGVSAAADISITARLAAADGSHLAESAPVNAAWSDLELSGGLYYWTTAGKNDSAFNTAVARYDFQGDTSMPSIYLSSDQAPPVPNGQPQCIGCHALSPDGTKLAFSMGGSLPGYFTLLDVASRTPTATDFDDKFVNMTSFSPDGTRMVNMAYGKLSLRTADASLNLLADDLFAADVNEKKSHPFWSPDGSKFAFVSWVPGMYGAANDVHVTGDMVQGAQIWIAPSDGTMMTGPATLLVPRDIAADGKSGHSYYYPAISDDGQFVVFNRSSCDGPANANAGDWGAGACDGYNDFSAQLMLVRASGGNPVALDKANGTGTLTNSWPRWSPDHGQFRKSTVYWVAFSSRRDYGLSLKGSTDGSTKPQLWFAAVVVSSSGEFTDPSFAPVWLPGQDPDLSGPRGNHTPVWTSVAVPVD